MPVRSLFRNAIFLCGRLLLLGGLLLSGGRARAQTCPPAACLPGNAPAGNLAFGMGIYRVQLADLDTATNGAADGYRDYSCRTGATLTRGASYTLTVRTNPNADEALRAWVDWNRDGVFAASELVLSSAAARQHAATFTVPATAPLGLPLRLRLAADYALAPAPGPCTAPQYSQTEDYRLTLQAAPVAPPAAAFASPDTLGCTGRVRFQDRSTHAPTSWRWDFGDGATSTQQQPTHQYTQPGTYAVTLRVCNALGCDSLRRPGYVTVHAGAPAPAACQPATTAYCCGFGLTRLRLAGLDHASADGRAGYEDFSCAFRALLTADRADTLRLTTGPAAHDVRVYLDLNDDGQFDPATERLYAGLGVVDPVIPLTVPAAAPGLVLQRPLRLRVVADHAGSAATGPCSAPQLGQVEDYSVVVQPNAAPPAAAFSVQYQRLCGPVEVALANTSTGGATSYQWDFGDGTTSALAAPPVHTYATGGVYDVRLVARNALGADTAWQQVVVAAACPVYCTAGGTGSTPSTPVTFTRVQLGAINNTTARPPGVGYFDFTAQQTALRAGHTYLVRTESPPWAFSGSGPWTSVTLWVDFNQDGQFGPSEMTGPFARRSPNVFTLYVPPTAKPGATRLRILLQDKNAYVVTTGCTPTYRIGTTEDYTVLILPDTVKPRAGFRADLTAACNATVQLRDTSYAGPTSWRWSFGDGTTSVLQHPQHTFAQPGTYSVSLRVGNRFGADSVTRTNYLTVTALNAGPRPAACVPPRGTTVGTRGIGILNIGPAFSYTQPANAPGYLDETCSGPTLTVAPGTGYAMQLANRYAPGLDVFVWLDANDDGIFDRLGEVVYNSLAYPPTPTMRTATFTLPPGTMLNRPLRLRAYFWGDGDQPPTAVPDPCHREEQTGQVRDFTVVATGTLSTASLASVKSNWSVAPNPSAGPLTFRGLPGTTEELQVWSVAGQLVLTQPLHARQGEARVQLPQLSPGLYLFRLRNRAGVQKVVIE